MDLHIPIDHVSGRTLRDQVYDGLRSAILDARLDPGTRLPSTRTLAGQLAISRFTVEDAYARLVSEGYAEGRQGSGTYVIDLVGSAGRGTAGMATSRPVPGRRIPERRWSTLGQSLTESAVASPPVTTGIRFHAGAPGLDEFPYALWNQMRARTARTVSPADLDYGSPAGEPALREAIAAYLGRARGIACSDEQVVITNGAQQAVDLLARLLVDRGDSVVVEDPGYASVSRALVVMGAHVVPVPVDVDGLRVDQLGERVSDAKLVYVTPSHQYPTGGVLPVSRRLALLEWARRHGVLVIEDDYDGEFRYGSRPVEALAGLDGGRGAQAVAYVGTFAKTLFPALRLGYVVLPVDTVAPFLSIKSIADRQQPTLEQLTLATFMVEGHFERHVARMRRLYASRRRAIIEALDAELSTVVHHDAATTDAGLHLLVGFDTPMSEAELLACAARAGVNLEAASVCYITAPPALPSVLLGYAHLPEDRIRAGISTLAQVLRTGHSVP